MDARRVLEGLDPEQRAVAEAVRGPVCVLAGAGTGKTRAITHRIAYAVLTGALQPQNVLAVTFTARAAGELRGRLRALGAPGVQARTFHAAAYKQLLYFWPRLVGGEPPRLIESKFALLGDAARACGLSLGRTELREAAGEIEWAKVTQTRPEDYPAAVAKSVRRPGGDVVDIARLYVMYEELRRERNLLDFEGMLELTAAMLAEFPEMQREVRGQYRAFVVDEYQDVNPLQKLLLAQWLGDRRELCVVGDPSQTIYSFTGATPDYLLGFTREFPEAVVVKLVRDYRSTPQVVGLANEVLKDAPGRLELLAQRPAGPVPVFTGHDNELDEAQDVARRAAKLVEAGVPAREIAVLFRINAQSEAFEQAFADAGVPYVLRGAERFFERPAVREAVVRLRGAARSGGDAELDGLGLIRQVRAVLAGCGFTDRPPEGRGPVREKWESLAALAQLAEDMAIAEPEAGLARFVAELEERAAAQHAPPLEGVTLASLHAAKGLEWDAVFLAGLADGTLPIVYAETPEQVEEERRLLYVGITRAREHLFLSWAAARSPGQRATRGISRFLDGVAPGSATPLPPRMERPAKLVRARGPQPCRVCGRSLLRAVEKKLGRCETCPAEVDEALLEALKEWRADAAEVQRVPAYVVFTDATLQAIAERKPANRAELAAIGGVGAVKLERYEGAVLALCRGETPGEIYVAPP
ncbi:ATP-dependent DNA helicase UvrD2 [Actinocorallia sp. API 0066]|uniref:ATP-dependent helicase n=1 Tax=Actinocorallia sp. API 0066 TaxID=2896846 RepID=UPI001E5AC9F6|nr:ATP-dependent DNA helicase UvrD2 [Actinocorallia sp. API 0066]MCD0448095.1 ATP-dependent DNA helicase UvrD2 [Actinocorallia sp. API 0066]